MKHYLFVLLMVGVLSAACIAQEAQEQVEEESWFSASLSNVYSTSYTTDFGMKCADDSWQSELELTFGNFYVGAFYNHGFRPYPGGEEEADWGKELDPTAGITGELFWGLQYDASITYWECWRNIFSGHPDGDNDYWYPALEVSKEIELSSNQILTPSVRVAFPMAVSDEGDNGTHVFLKATHGLQLNEKTSLETWLSFVGDDGGLGLQPGWLSEPGVTVSYQLAKHISLNAGVRGTVLFSKDMKEKGVRENDVIFASGLVLELFP